jgi:hypothetical protein
MNKKAITIASLNVRNLRKNSPKQKENKAWVTSLAMPPTNSIPVRTPLGGSGLCHLIQGGRVLERSLLLEPQHPNGMLAKVEHEHLYSRAQILHAPNYLQ